MTVAPLLSKRRPTTRRAETQVLLGCQPDAALCAGTRGPASVVSARRRTVGRTTADRKRTFFECAASCAVAALLMTTILTDTTLAACH